jgi:hypothetical protein
MQFCYGYVTQYLSDVLQQLCMVKRELLEPNSIVYRDKQHTSSYPLWTGHSGNLWSTNHLPLPLKPCKQSDPPQAGLLQDMLHNISKWL